MGYFQSFSTQLQAKMQAFYHFLEIIGQTLYRFMPLKKQYQTLQGYWSTSIRRQLIIGIAAVHAVLMTIFVIDLTEQQRTFLQQQSLKQAIALAENLAANSGSWVLASDVMGMRETLSYQMRYPGLEYALITNLRGQVLAHTDSQWIGHYLTDEIGISLFENQKVTPTAKVLLQTATFLDVAAPILSGNKLLGWVRVGLSTKMVERNLQTVILNGLFYAVLAIVIGVLFAIFLANSLTAGLNNLLLVIEQVKLGEREVRADELRQDEIGRLGKGFNAMLYAIKESDEKMQEAKQVAEAANVAKSQFIANMSHELRTPLNAVIGYSEMLKEDFEDLSQEEVVIDLHKINASGKHLLSLINDVLDLSKIESGKMEVFNETFNISTMVDEVLTTIEVLIKQRRNRLELRYERPVGLMYGDLIKLRQVLLNLLGNASKFTENGVIQLVVNTFEKEGLPWVSFSIQDNGIGIPKDQQKLLFKPFKQVDGSTTRKYGGTGLGLVISKHFVEMMGGFIELESEAEKGTRFVVALPTKIMTYPAFLEKETDNLSIDVLSHVSNPSSEKIVEENVTENKPTVLVIDDDNSTRDLLSKHIGKMGYKVIVADNGQEGLRLAREIRPDAITLDVMMPGIDGWMVLSELKNDINLQSIPVIMLSMVENQELGYSLGASEYLLKPIDHQQIFKVLQKYHAIKQRDYSVMVIEDDRITQDLTRDMLQRHGWKVTLANNGKVALELAEKTLPDLILLDLMMPEMDGFEFLNHLRHHADLKNIPVIVLTAKEMTRADREYLTSRVNAIFQKGAYHRDDLLTQLQELLMSSTNIAKKES